MSGVEILLMGLAFAGAGFGAIALLAMVASGLGLFVFLSAPYAMYAWGKHSK
jgi:hypothetical protein